MDTVTKLQQLGLSKNQADTYLACLQLGESKAQDVIRRVKLPRATVYLTLEELEGRGPVTSYDKSSIKHFAPENPERLVRWEQSRAELAEQIFPELKILYAGVDYRPTIHFYRGLDQIKEMYNGLLTLRHKTFRVIGSEEYWLKADADWFKDYARRRGQRGIKTHIIFEDSPAARESKALRPYGRVVKFVPQKFKKRLMTSDCTILPDRVIFHNYGKEFVGVAVESKEAAGLMQLLFDIAWEGIPG